MDDRLPTGLGQEQEKEQEQEPDQWQGGAVVVVFNEVRG